MQEKDKSKKTIVEDDGANAPVVKIFKEKPPEPIFQRGPGSYVHVPSPFIEELGFGDQF